MAAISILPSTPWILSGLSVSVYCTSSSLSSFIAEGTGRGWLRFASLHHSRSLGLHDDACVEVVFSQLVKKGHLLVKPPFSRHHGYRASGEAVCHCRHEPTEGGKKDISGWAIVVGAAVSAATSNNCAVGAAMSVATSKFAGGQI